MKDSQGELIEVGDEIVYGRYGGDIVRARVLKTGMGKHRWTYNAQQETVTVCTTKYPGTKYEYEYTATLRSPEHIFVYKKNAKP